MFIPNVVHVNCPHCGRPNKIQVPQARSFSQTGYPWHIIVCNEGGVGCQTAFAAEIELVPKIGVYMLYAPDAPDRPEERDET